QRGPHRRNLRDDIDAVTVVVDHFGQAADLAFDPAQPFLTGCLDVFSHGPYIPLQGIGCKWTGEIDDRSRERRYQRHFKGSRLRVQGGWACGNGEDRVLWRGT